VWHILHSDLDLHPYKLQIVHFLSNQDKEVCLQFCHQFQGILTDNPDLLNNLLMSDRHIFIGMAQLISRTFDSGLLQILMKITNAPFMSQKLSFGVLFGPEQSLDPTSLRMKTDKPSHSHLNVTRR
jgi:hypothetical protein